MCLHKVHAVYAATGNYTNTNNIVTVNAFLSEFINKQYTKLSVHQVYIFWRKLVVVRSTHEYVNKDKIISLFGRKKKS